MLSFGKLLEFSIIRRPLTRLLMRCVARELSGLGIERIVFYDIGARWGIWPAAKAIPLPIYSVGFDADPAEAERLERDGAFSRVIPHALSDTKGMRTIYIAKEPGLSSLRKPRADLIAQHCLADNHETVKTIEVSACTLDEAIAQHKLPPPDYIKLDVEGSDIDVIMSSLNTLRESCCGLFFEARLAPFYDGEKLLGDGVQALIANGFALIRLDSVGSFAGAMMLFDCGLVRNPKAQAERLPVPQLLKSSMFCLLLENWGYARRLIEEAAGSHQFKNPVLRALVRRWRAG